MRKELNIRPEGDIADWNFHTEAYCGKAIDSVGISLPHSRNGETHYVGCALTRKDVKRLRKYLQWAESTWNIPAKKLEYT